MFSVCSAFTLDMVTIYKERIEHYSKKEVTPPITVVGTQGMILRKRVFILTADRTDKREVSKKEGLSVALSLGCPFSEFSAKENTKQDVRDILTSLVTEIKQNR